MECREFRERCGAEPRRRDEALAAHEAKCAACARYAEKARGLDALIRDALYVPVPLAARAAETRARVRRSSLAIAATLAIAAVTGALLYFAASGSDRTLAHDVIAHLQGEAAAVAAMRSTVDPGDVQSVLAGFGARLAAHVGPVLDARVCIVGGKEVVHLVVASGSGPVTVMLLPDDSPATPLRIDAATAAGHLRGRILTSGPGSIAIVGHEQRVDREAEEQLVQSIQWEEA